jgi:hypothetical protein
MAALFLLLPVFDMRSLVRAAPAEKKRPLAELGR